MTDTNELLPAMAGTTATNLCNRRFTDDDLNTIVQDWSTEKMDQATAIGLARNLIEARAEIRRLSARASAGEGGDVGNEWADMATNGVQWLRNIRDGISTADEALAEMESNARRIIAITAAPQPAQTQGEECNTPTFVEVWEKLQPVERAIISAQFMEPSRSSQPAAARLGDFIPAPFRSDLAERKLADIAPYLRDALAALDAAAAQGGLRFTDETIDKLQDVMAAHGFAVPVRVISDAFRTAMLAAAPQPQEKQREPCYCRRCHPTLGDPSADPPATAPCTTPPAHSDGEVALPDLPEGQEYVEVYHDLQTTGVVVERRPFYDCYTADQMREYAQHAIATRPAPTAEPAGVDRDAARPDVPGYGGAPIDFDDPELQQW